MHAVLYDAADAERFRRAPPEASAILALTPAARARVADARLPVIGSESTYSDRGHARAAARIVRARRALAAVASAEGGLTDTARELLEWRGIHAVALSAGLWEAIGRTGPWTVPDGDGWLTTADRAAAHAALVAHVLRRRRPSPPPPEASSAAADVILGLAALALRRRRVVLLSGFKRGFDRAARSLAVVEPGLLTLGPTAQGDVRGVVKGLWTLLRRGAAILPIPGAPDEALRRRLEAALRAPGRDPVIARGLAAAARHIAAEIAEAERFARGLSRFARLARPCGALVWDTFGGRNLAVAEATRRSGGWTLVASHATASVPDGAVAAAFRDPWGRRMTAGPNLDGALVQSPAVEEVLRRLKPEMSRRRVQPFTWSRQPPAASSGPQNVVLWAGNYHTWDEHQPWVGETADEMVEGLRRLAEAVLRTKDLALVVRAKPNWPQKQEAEAADVAALLPRSDRVTVRSTGSYAEDLAQAAIVVSHASTAVEEGLAARKPVLLWGGRGRSRFVDGRPNPPAPGDRGAVYAPAWNADLAPWLEAITAAHRGRPLTDAELAPFCWGGEVPTIEEIAPGLFAVAADGLPSAGRARAPAA